MRPYSVTELIMTPTRMPVLFVGHGSPMNAIEQNSFTTVLKQVAKSLPKPKAVCSISAHWITRGARVVDLPKPRTIHDFYGFPRPLYEVQYPAPGSPEEAKRIAREAHLHTDEEWGLDHGTWAVLRHMYPDADIPVFQVSLDVGRDLAGHLALGRELQSLRDRGVLVLGSGNLVHNLMAMRGQRDATPFPWASEFDDRVKNAIENRETAALANPGAWGEKLFEEAHPSLDHYLPILYTIGATDAKDDVSFPYEGLEHGSVSMRMALFQPPAAA